MNKIRTQFLALLALMLMGTSTANAVDYGIYVGETMVTSDNASNITGNGQFSYNASTKTLTVSNANLNNQGSLGSGIRNDAVDGLTIRLVGTSTLTTRMNAISSYKNFSITGTGTLNVTAGSRGIITYSQSAVTCTINGPTLNITASNYAFEDYYGTTTLSVKGADTRVTLKTGSTINAVNNLKSLSLGDGLKIVHPSGASFNSSQKTVVANDTACKGTVAIGITYGLYIGEKMVNSYNYDDVNGDGMFAYRPNSKTLDVRSGTFTNTGGSLGSGISNREIDGLTIHITGTTVNINARNSAVYSEKSFKITGPGTLNATSTTSYALGFGGTDSKTCTITTDANGSSPKINIKAASYAVSDYRGNTTLALQGANTVLTLQPGSGYAAVNNLMDLTFADGLAIVSPTGGASPYFNSSLKTITVDGATGYKGKIEMAYDYGMYIGETRVSKLNYTDILGNGQFKYDPSSKTLTVNNATLTNEGSLGNGIDNREISGLTIYLTGTNTITTRNSPIATAKSINIKGSGTLNATAQYAPGISFWGTGNKTCVVSGPKLNIISTGYYALDDNSGNTTLQVEGSNTSISLEQKSSYATINNLKALSLASGYYITEPAGAEYSSSLKSITMDGSTPTTEKVVISNTQPDLGIWIDNTRVTPENLNDILGNGQLSYNLQTKTLTMTNFNYNKTSGNGSVISSKVKDLTIRVVGTNSITSNNYVLGSQGSLTFTGTGSLTLRCNTDAGVSGIALWSEDNGSSADVINCTFDGPKVTIISPNGTAFTGNTEDENTIIVKGSTTRLDMQPSSNPGNNGCMFLINDFQMGSGISIIEPEGAYFDPKFGDFTLDGTSEYKGRVVVSADIDYGISIGETIVKASNASDVLGNGQFSYDYETNTLTVKNADLDNTVVGPSEMPANQGTGIVNWNNEGLTVVLEGNNVIKCRGGAISANVSTNITGHGKLTCETTESWAFNLQGAGTVCTIDGPTLDITGATYALADENYHTSKLVVKGTSNITLWSGTNYQTIKGIGDLELGSDIYINQPEGGYFSKQLGTVTTNGSFAYQGKINIGYYSINIGGTKITPENAKDVLGDGTVSYHADAKMLTLRNANIINTNSQVSYGQGIVAIGVDGLTIKVEGNNTLTSKSWALSATKNFSITGTGSLTITATDNGAVALWSNDGDDINCTIDGPQLTLISATNGSSFSGSYGYQSTVIVKGSTTRVDMQPEQTQYGNECLYLIDDFKVSSDLYVTEPYGAYFDPNLKDFTLDGTKKYCGRVVVGPAVDYGFLVADEVVTTANAKDVLGNGQFSYDPATNVLTMKDANLTKTDGTLGTGIDIRSTQDLTINIEGTNYIKTRNEPIASIKSFRITGTGTLNAIAAASEGMLFWSRDTMTCTVNGPKINIQGLASGLVDYYNTTTLRVEGSTTSLSFQPITTNLTDWSTQPINEYQDVNDFTIKGLKSLIMGSGVSIIEPQGGRFNASLQSITTDGTNAYKGKVTIGTNEDYGFYVAETRVKTSNANDILGDGCFSYDPASKTLYVRNAHLENQGSLGSGISNREVEGMTIVLEGDNYFNTRMNVIGMQKSTTITGRGTLTATSTDGYGLSLTEKGSNCTISGPKLDFKVRTSPISCYRDSITLIVEGAQTEISMETTGGYKTIDNLSFLLLGNGLYLTEPADGWFSESVKSVTTDGTNAYKGKVVISNREPSQGEQKCDLNGDGIINALDIQNVIMACVAMITDPKFDINGDGVVNALDIQNVINAAAAAARRMGLELE